VNISKVVRNKGGFSMYHFHARIFRILLRYLISAEIDFSLADFSNSSSMAGRSRPLLFISQIDVNPFA
jgi:hypothetical protein